MHLLSRHTTLLAGGGLSNICLGGRKPVITGILFSGGWLNQEFSNVKVLKAELFILDLLELEDNIEQFPSNWGIPLILGGWGRGAGGVYTPLTSLNIQTCWMWTHCTCGHTCSGS